LISAWALLRERGRQESLVLVGKMDYFFERLRRYSIEHGYDRGPAKIVFPGYVTDGQLRWLYRHAQLYVFPSLIEGFGLPGLEAMFERCPVAAARSSSLPEILGDAALYFDPHDSNDIARQIVAILNSPELRADLLERGERQARLFSWEAMSQATLKLYTELLY
jgi:glycosyltransferase involved in cell wall biosynthesis